MTLTHCQTSSCQSWSFARTKQSHASLLFLVAHVELPNIDTILRGTHRRGYFGHFFCFENPFSDGVKSERDLRAHESPPHCKPQAFRFTLNKILRGIETRPRARTLMNTRWNGFTETETICGGTADVAAFLFDSVVGWMMNEQLSSKMCMNWNTGPPLNGEAGQRRSLRLQREYDIAWRDGWTR
jgi:hypothetical protein